MTVQRLNLYLCSLATLLLVIVTHQPKPAQETGSPAAVLPEIAVAGEHKEPLLSAYLADKFKRPLPQTRKIVATAFQEGRELGLPPELILGIIAKESSFRPAAESGYGAKGLMQVVPRFHGKLLETHAEGNPFHLEGNIRVGSRILKQYLEAANGDLRKALARYSGGASNYHADVTDYWSEYKLVGSSLNRQGETL